MHCGKEPILCGDTFLCGHCDAKYGSSSSNAIVFCHNCGQRVFIDDAYEIGWDFYCLDCAEEETGVCWKCHNTFPLINIKIFRGRNYCKSCYGEVSKLSPREMLLFDDVPFN